MAPPSTWRLPLCMAPPSAWRLPLYKAPSSLALAPYAKRPLDSTVIHVGIQSLHGARPFAGRTRPPGTPASPCARRQLHPTRGGLRVFPQPGGQLPQRRGVPKETLRSTPGRSSERPTPTQRPTRRSPPPARHTKADDARRASRSASPRTKTHTPTAHSQRSARQHANTDFYFRRWPRAPRSYQNGRISTTPPIATKLRRTATRATRSRLSKGQPDPTRSSSKRPRDLFYNNRDHFHVKGSLLQKKESSVSSK